MAEDLMTPNPVSIRDDATVQDALVLLTESGAGAVPVIDEAGQPVGVVSRSDVLLHEREAAVAVGKDWKTQRALPVRDLMTPAVFSVRPHTSAARVVEEMLALNVQRLFVVDESGVLIGTICATDILRRLHADEA